MDAFLKLLTTSPIIALTAAIVFLIIAIIYLIAFFQGREITFWPPKIGAKPAKIIVEASKVTQVDDKPIVFLGGYPRSQHPNFFAEVEKLLPKAKKITLIATGLNLIWEKHILDLLIDRAKSGDAIVTICLGNPYSPHVEDRLIEEEMQGNRPPVGRDGIIRNVKALVERLDAAGNPPNFSVVLFENYPTFATLIFDQELFIYPYGYQVLGNVSPIFHFQNNDSEESKFFISNAERIIRDSVSAKDIVSRKINPKFYSDSWKTKIIRTRQTRLRQSNSPLCWRSISIWISYDLSRCVVFCN